MADKPDEIRVGLRSLAITAVSQEVMTQAAMEEPGLESMTDNTMMVGCVKEESKTTTPVPVSQDVMAKDAKGAMDLDLSKDKTMLGVVQEEANTEAMVASTSTGAAVESFLKLKEIEDSSN